jgi:hypothetical protein
MLHAYELHNVSVKKRTDESLEKKRKRRKKP